MHGVPPDLPLAPFLGSECNQVALGRFQIQFHFGRVGSISAESRWELRASSGELVDGVADHLQRDCYRVHKIIDVPVTRFTIDSPKSFTLYFESGHALTIYDDSDRYESLSVNLLGRGSFYI